MERKQARFVNGMKSHGGFSNIVLTRKQQQTNLILHHIHMR